MVGSLVSPQLVTVSCPLSQNLFIARTFSQNIINSSVANGRPHGPQPHPSWLLGGLSFCGHSADTEFTIAWPPGAQNMTFYSLSLLGLESFLLHLLKQPPSLKSVVWMSCWGLAPTHPLFSASCATMGLVFSSHQCEDRLLWWWLGPVFAHGCKHRHSESGWIPCRFGLAAVVRSSLRPKASLVMAFWQGL